MNLNSYVNMCGEKYELQTGLISGRSENGEEMPVSLYFGALNLDEIHTMLYYTNRTVIKLLINQFNIELENVDHFLTSAMNEALVKEHNISAGITPDQDELRFGKFRNNQN